MSFERLVVPIRDELFILLAAKCQPSEQGREEKMLSSFFPFTQLSDWRK